ncbi:hypothetical protein IWW36_003727 [Coemansia brasiliensis]|uniref:BZIP domain-containing protein n=1 Tax=Coemansia brasiliensis TaxID=2650707 RepID=A0A9W8I4N2_9FUNG|nr:hypothetical protein IWW36_003727 [Coemansia brasiliensis]
MGTGSAQSEPMATIDPLSLNSMDMDGYVLGGSDISANDTADSNSLLSAALYSAFGSHPNIAAATNQELESARNGSAMLVDMPTAVAAEPSSVQPALLAATATTPAKPQPAKPFSTTPRKQTIQQQALSTAGKRTTPMPSSSLRKAVPKQPTAAPVNDTASPLKANVASGAKLVKQEVSCETGDHSAEDAEMEGIDMKNLTSKERRQLRNKISARNFRVRRKEYISNLEAEVRMHKEEADGLRRELSASKKDNMQLREELQRLKQKLNAMGISQPSNATTTTATATAPLSAAPAPVRATAPAHMPRQQPIKSTPAVSQPAPMIRFNPHKDVPQSAAKSRPSSSAAPGSNWAAKGNRSGYIAVNTAMLSPSYSTTVAEVMAEIRRKQVVATLLDIDNPNASEHLSVDTLYKNDSADHKLALATAVLNTASIIAELVLPQLALESSLNIASNAAPLPVLQVAC